MSKREEFINYLYDNNIFCESCKYNTYNTPIKNVTGGVCGNENNRHSGAYSGSVTSCTSRVGVVCDLWEEYERVISND